MLIQLIVDYETYKQLFFTGDWVWLFILEAWISICNARTHYWDGNTVLVANFNEDMDLSTTTLEGGKVVGSDLAKWSEEKVMMKYVEGTHSAVRLDWDRTSDKGTPEYMIILSDTEIVTDEKSDIVFSMADRVTNDSDKPDYLLNLSVQVEDTSGNKASLPLNRFGVLLLMFNGDIVKWPFTSVQPTKEPVFQNFPYHLQSFIKLTRILNLNT